MPLSLSGVRRILEMMDWGEAASFVALGQVTPLTLSLTPLITHSPAL
jgi:hypothetical protein